MSGQRRNAADVCLAVFTRDLRVHDNPLLSSAAAGGGMVVPVFVHDDAILRGRPRRPERDGYLEAALEDLDRSLRLLGTRLVQRQGDWPTEILALATETESVAIHVLDDVTPYARRRLDRLRTRAGDRIAVRAHAGETVLPPGAVTPGSSDHYRIFTPYYQRWLDTPWRPVLPAPRQIQTPPSIATEVGRASHQTTNTSMGEHAARERLSSWLAHGVEAYATRRERLDDDAATSRLSTDLHFGCLSALEVAARARAHEGATAFVRQLCWRDFYMQAVAARPEVVWENFVARPWSPRVTPAHLSAWQEGRTGYPLVDAAMRQLLADGFLPNRARMVAASFLAKHLELDWRDGASHFLELLVDADVVANNLNWQWTAGTGTGSHPSRALSPLRQGQRFDPDGTYVRRYVPELAAVPASRIHDPSPEDRQTAKYPLPITAR